MADWDGRGLPPVAAERARRAAAGGAWTSLLSAPAAAGLKMAGFEPVGEVMGSIVQQIGWSGYGGCGIYGGYGSFGGLASPTITSSDSMRFGGFRPYVDALYRGYGTALGRMVQEAATIGADGVVGVGLTMSPLPTEARASSPHWAPLCGPVATRGRTASSARTFPARTSPSSWRPGGCRPTSSTASRSPFATTTGVRASRRHGVRATSRYPATPS